MAPEIMSKDFDIMEYSHPFIKMSIKGATKLYFMNYSRVVIILFGTGTFSTYSFGKTRFSSFYILVFCVSVSLCFCFCIFVVLQYVLNSMS